DVRQVLRDQPAEQRVFLGRSDLQQQTLAQVARTQRRMRGVPQLLQQERELVRARALDAALLDQERERARQVAARVQREHQELEHLALALVELDEGDLAQQGFAQAVVGGRAVLHGR